MRRETILDVIRNNPGIGFNQISRQTKLSNGVISHYILQLQKDKEITKSGNRAKYFISKFPKKDKELLLVLLNTTNCKIVRVLLENDIPIKLQSIGKIIGRSTSTVSISLKKMEKENIVSREIMNQNSKITADIGYVISDKNLIMRIISEYNLDCKK